MLGLKNRLPIRPYLRCFVSGVLYHCTISETSYGTVVGPPAVACQTIMHSFICQTALNINMLSPSLCHKRPAQDLPASLPCKRSKPGHRAQVAGSLVSRSRHKAPVAIFAAAAALNDLDIEMPDIDADLHSLQEEAGAQFDVRAACHVSALAHS